MRLEGGLIPMERQPTDQQHGAVSSPPSGKIFGEQIMSNRVKSTHEKTMRRFGIHMPCMVCRSWTMFQGRDGVIRCEKGHMQR